MCSLLDHYQSVRVEKGVFLTKSLRKTMVNYRISSARSYSEIRSLFPSDLVSHLIQYCKAPPPRRSCFAVSPFLLLSICLRKCNLHSTENPLSLVDPLLFLSHSRSPDAPYLKDLYGTLGPAENIVKPKPRRGSSRRLFKWRRRIETIHSLLLRRGLIECAMFEMIVVGTEAPPSKQSGSTVVPYVHRAQLLSVIRKPPKSHYEYDQRTVVRSANDRVWKQRRQRREK